jgi:urease accessory protein
MLTLIAHAPESEAAGDRLVLPFESRRKSRLRAKLESGVEVALRLERGVVLHDGDRLIADNGGIVQIVAADEAVAVVTADDPLRLMRAAYHLGNRHIPVQVGPGWLRLEQDHVLEHMLEHLGVRVTHEQAPFEPEAGAYGGFHGHHHDGDAHDHDHE